MELIVYWLELGLVWSWCFWYFGGFEAFQGANTNQLRRFIDFRTDGYYLTLASFPQRPGA